MADQIRPESIQAIRVFKKNRIKVLMATGDKAIAIPLSAGGLYSSGLVLGPAIGAVMMSMSTIIVAINAQFLRNRLGEK